MVELDAIRTLLDHGTTVVGCGGGGIPVDGAMQGVDAVIDKDRASTLLASALPAERLVILTAVPAVYEGFGTPAQEELRELSARGRRALLRDAGRRARIRRRSKPRRRSREPPAGRL